jgi:hypothetical protein
MVVDIGLNVVVPYVAYAGLRHAGWSEARALLLTALVPALVAVVSLVRRRRMNVLSLLVLAATGLSLTAMLLSGSAWFALVQPSFVTGAIALGFLASLAMARPALFYLARDTVCPTAALAREFEAHWESAPFRRLMRKLTLVWAAFLGGEALLRCGLAALWPNPYVVQATQILWIILPVLLVRWSIKAGQRLEAAG